MNLTSPTMWRHCVSWVACDCCQQHVTDYKSCSNWPVALLQHLYGQVHIPNGIWEELHAHGRVWPGAAEVGNASWVSRHPVTNNPLVVMLERDLDRGEAETIALAIELKADLVLMDECDGRNHVRRHGLEVIGVLGILIDAKKSGLVDAVLPHIDAMRRLAGFYISASVYDAVRQLTNE